MEFETMMHCFENPVKRRIVATLFDDGPMTPKELMTGLNGTSQATLYRALSSMESEGIIDVVSQEKKRAVIERTYGISKAYIHLKDAIVRENNVSAYTAIMGWSMHRLYSMFERYAQQDDVNIAEDGSGFISEDIYVNDQDIQDIKRAFTEIVSKYTVRTSEDQQHHVVAQILTPPEELSKDE